MAAKKEREPGNVLEGLKESDLNLLRFLRANREEMVHLLDVITVIAGLPSALQGQWFDRRHLTPDQAIACDAARKEVTIALRKLFRLGLVDVGTEETFPEGFKRHHLEVIKALQSHPAWRSGAEPSARSVASLEDEIRARLPWAHATDLRVVQTQMGARVELFGFTELGRSVAETLPG